MSPSMCDVLHDGDACMFVYDEANYMCNGDSMGCVYSDDVARYM